MPKAVRCLTKTGTGNGLVMMSAPIHAVRMYLTVRVALLDLLADNVLREAEMASSIVGLRVAQEGIGTLIVPEEHHEAVLALRQLGEELRRVQEADTLGFGQ